MVLLLRRRIIVRLFCHSSCKTLSQFSRTKSTLSDLSSMKFRPMSGKQPRPLKNKTKAAAQEVQAKVQRMQDMLQGEKREFAPAEVCLQVVQSGCSGYGKCLLLWTDSTSYLFNCPEGTQRLFAEHRLRMSRLEHIFFTRASWLNSGGLPGVTLMLDGAGNPNLTIHGPENLEQIFEVVRPFAEEVAKIRVTESPYQKKKYEDAALDVQYVSLFSKNHAAKAQPIKSLPSKRSRSNSPTKNVKTSPSRKKSTEEDKILESMSKIEKAIDRRENNSEENGSSSTMQESMQFLSVAYICELRQRPGKMNLRRCMDLKVPVGPLLGELQAGKSVVLSDGRVVNPDDVITPPERPPRFVVVECPGEDFLDSLCTCGAFEGFKGQQKGSEMFVDLVCHMSKASLVHTDAYQEWMRSFGPDTQHLLLNSDCAYFPHSEGQFRTALQLHTACPRLFPELRLHAFDMTQLTDLPPAPGSKVMAEPFLQFHLRPYKGFEREAIQSQFDQQAIQKACWAQEDFKKEWEKFERERLYNGDDEESEYPELIFLGTCSSTPTKHRNVSGILVNINAHTSALLDCGESTYNQLFHLVGPAETDRLLINLKLVFISHLHQDHLLGLFTVVHRRKEAFSRNQLPYEPFCLLAPAPLHRMHDLYSRLIEDLGPYAIRVPTKSDLLEEILKDVATTVGLRKLALVKVYHPMMANALVLVDDQGRKLVFSGDTRPMDLLVKEGQGADVLIHEATFEKDLAADAISKKHSTVFEAIDVGKRMNAKFTLLTHFSSRYWKIPIVTDDFDDSVGIAFDFLRIKLNQMKLLPKLTPVLKALYSEEHDEMLRRSLMISNRRKLEQEAMM